MAKRTKSRAVQPEPQIVFNNVPLDADAYTVVGEFTEVDRRRIRLAWEKINVGLPKKKILLLVPKGMELEALPSDVLRGWMETCANILKERGA